MTTHRLDTVSLAPIDDSDVKIFTIQKQQSNMVIEIQKCHKLLAMYRMSSNLKQLSCYHHKVYTESFDDAQFYENIYISLKKLSSKIRQKQQQNKDYYMYPKVEGENKQQHQPHYRLLSDRCQLQFYSCSTKNNANGGSDHVKHIVEQESNYQLSNYPQQNINLGLYEQGLFISYGIVDKDYEEKKKFPPQILILKNRHSLENFIMDPFIFCQIFSHVDIEQYLKNAYNEVQDEQKDLKEILQLLEQIKEDSEKQEIEKIFENIQQLFDVLTIKKKEHLLLEYKNYLDNFLYPKKDEKKKFSLQIFIDNKRPQITKRIDDIEQNKKNFSEQSANFIKICNELHETIQKKNFNNIQAHIEDYFQCYLKPVSLYNFVQSRDSNSTNIKNLKLIQSDITAKLKQIQDLNSHSNIKPTICDTSSSILIDHEDHQQIIHLKYPKEILNLRGHDLIDCFIGQQQKQSIVQDLIKKMHKVSPLKCIPLDLAEIFFDLNFNVRTHIRSIIKKDQKDPQAQFSQ